VVASGSVSGVSVGVGNSTDGPGVKVGVGVPKSISGGVAVIVGVSVVGETVFVGVGLAVGVEVAGNCGTRS